jgi:hypothetical protein
MAFAARAEAPAHRRELDDVAAALPAHQRDRGLGHDDRAEQVGLDLPAEVVQRGVLHRIDVAVARVVDQHVEPAERLSGEPHGGVCCVRVGDVQRGQPHRVAVALCQVRQWRRIACSRHQAVAGLQHGLRQGAAEAARATGDEPSLRHGNLLRCARPGTERMHG